MDNQAQIDFWNGTGGDSWARNQVALDGMLSPLGEAGIRRLDPQSGEKVIDVGCGCGASSLQMARLGCDVTGVDVSEPMLALARRRADDEKLQAAFTCADAATHAASGFDGLFARFGVMFFADPTAAFANLHSALKADGRLTFVCWQPVLNNPWIAETMSILIRHVGPQTPGDPHAPGPFAFADPARVTRILEEAGFGDISVDGHNEDILMGPDTDTALRFLSEIGPTSRLLAEQSDAVKEAVRTELEKYANAHLTSDGVRIGASVWVVSASA